MEYWYCSECGMAFSDEAATQEVTSTVTDALGHDWDEGVVTKEPSCTEEGERLFKCSRDETHTKTEPIEKLAHTPEKVDAAEATCTEDGHIAYWECAVCHQLFADEACHEELTEEDVVLHAMHDLTAHAAATATCTTAGNSAYWSCSRCGKYFSDSEGENEIAKDSWVLPANGHTLTKTEAKNPSCTEAGNSEYWT